MINLRRGNTETILFTGTENVTLTNPYFLFVFTHRATKAQVLIMTTNTSTTKRADKVAINVNSYFSSVDDGLYEYNVYEKASNTDMTVSGNIVEQGYMVLRPTTDFAPTEYSQQSNTFTSYNGQ